MANESASETIPQIGNGKGNNYSTPFELFVPNNTFLQGEYSMKHERKLREVKIMLGNAGKDSLESLIMIDALHCLGIDYHFHEEIQDILQTRFLDYRNCGCLKDDLFEVSTSFRLLRQQGYDVSIDYFNNFINKEGKLKCELSKDVRGLMSLYEASQLSMKGEEIIDEAADSSAQFLNELMPYLDHHQARVVSSTLQHPYHKTLQSLLPKKVLAEGQNRWVNVLQELAKMEFNMVQSLHQKEVLQVFT